MPARGKLVLLLVILLLPAQLAGCLKLEAAHVPENLLANGWRKDEAQSDEEPTSQSNGLAKTQTLAYRDRATDDRGYPGELKIITLRALVTPSEESLLEQVQEQLKAAAEANGVRIDEQVSEGSRALANEGETSWFVYDGNVTQESGLFARNARVKILGEVWRCRDERTTVVAVALAQITDARSLSTIRLPPSTDTTTWREIVADPTGTIDGHRGANGLVYNVACS